ncbi:hypothetical protein R5R35_010336 [Gryllus longicercus]|uniref:Mutator-like transposase domain-containing protein n=1 Tax=Gryllus longicercus TaxID=2509291 RepID=A0AAN9WI43_9ORTH
MEPNCAVNLIAKNPVFKEAGIRVGVLVGDDSSTIAAVQKETQVVEKWVDTNHNTKNFNNKLYLAAKKYTFLNHGVIKYLKRCFSYCIVQNKNNVPNGEWCKAKSNLNYIFKALPGGKPFQCAAWSTDLDVLLASQVAKAAQIAPGASSQQNESFNSMCAAKASKRMHYANSYAHHVRVSCAVNTKNLGSSHLCSI